MCLKLKPGWKKILEINSLQFRANENKTIRGSSRKGNQNVRKQTSKIIARAIQ